MQTFPQRCRRNGSNVRLTDDGPFSSFQGRSSSASSFNVSLLQAIDGAVFLALCPSQACQHLISSEVSQTPQHFISSEKQGTHYNSRFVTCFNCIYLLLVLLQLRLRWELVVSEVTSVCLPLRTSIGLFALCRCVFSVKRFQFCEAFFDEVAWRCPSYVYICFSGWLSCM